MTRPVEEMDDVEMIQETLQRARRIETRVAGWLEEQGFDRHNIKAKWGEPMGEGSILIPSREIRLIELLKTVPAEWKFEPVRVYCGQDYLFTLQC